MNYGTSGLQTLEREPDSNAIEVPESRMSNPRTTQDWCRRLIDNDSKRSRKRALVNGLTNGNPPYKAGLLRDAGQAQRCNVNWGTARGLLEASAGSFYDLTAEAPGFITIRLNYADNPEQEGQWSNIVSEECDKIFKSNPMWIGDVSTAQFNPRDYNMQLSQQNMVLHGCGPMVFESPTQVFPKAVLCGDLKVPEFTKSDTSYWDGGMIQTEYFPPQLYEFIKNEKAASASGWDVEYTKLVIAAAMDIRQDAGVQRGWEFYQQELKNNSLSYYDDTKICRVCHVFWKEFNGKVTHVIVERDTSIGSVKTDGSRDLESSDIRFLYRNIGKYSSFQNCVHPMYFDHGNGGFHHSVDGLGVKMYSAMEYENRLICNLADKAFAPKILFSPTTTETAQKFQLVHMGDFAVMPGGFKVEQGGVAGLMNDGLAMHGQIQSLMQSNLSSYQQQVPPQRRGNPETAFEKKMEASQQSSLNKTQFNRYYEQLDMLYAEIYRRLTTSPDEPAVYFRKCCKDRGVPVSALKKVQKVQATRVVGQGSAFMRKQSIDAIFPIAGALPEEGRANLLSDKIAAEAGQSAVSRYYPRRDPQLATDQEAEAMQWVSAMKVGVPPVITGTQDALTYAQTFLRAASEAMASLEQGGNPMEVYKFLTICGPAIAAHLKRMSADPTRQQQFKILTEQWKTLAAMTDKLRGAIEKMQQAAQEQQQATQAAMTDEQLKTAKVLSDIKLKEVKTQAQLGQSAQKHNMKLSQEQQDMAIKDIIAAAEIIRDNAKAEQDKKNSAAKKNSE